MMRENESLAIKIEQRIFRKLLVYFSIFAGISLVAGIGLGTFFGERKTLADPKNMTNMAEAISSNFVEVSKRVETAVVNIDTKGKIPQVTLSREQEKFPESLKEIFREQQRKPVYGVGSGFIVDSKGYILTNYHVVEDSSRITVRLQSGAEYTAKIVGTDEETDLAVLKIDSSGELPSVKLGDSNSVQVGDWVLAIGSPFGLAQTVTAGIISQVQRETPYATVFQKFIQTDAAINRGNSGGPLVNMQGEVIGINSQIATQTGEFSGIGFSLPSNEAAFVYQQILKNGKVRRGYLGVALDSVKPEFARVYGLGDVRGAIIVEIRDVESPAAKAGLSANDIITELNGVPINNAQDLISKVALNEPDKEINLTYFRETNNKVEKAVAVVKLGERPTNSRSTVDEPDTPKKLPITPTKTEFLPFGLTLAELTPQNAKILNLEGQKGLLVKEIDPASFIADVRNAVGTEALNKNDIIKRINRVEIKDLKTFNEYASKLKKGDPVVLHVSFFNKNMQRIQSKIVQFTIQ